MWVVEQLKADGSGYKPPRLMRENYYGDYVTSDWVCVADLFTLRRDAIEILRNCREKDNRKYRIRRVILGEV